MKKEQSHIPVSKIKRATKFVKTGMKVGGNYVRHYSKKLVNNQLDREALDKQNAEDIYDTLSELKGSALKMAQTLSMDKGMLPSAYAEKFVQAQYNAPPLSGPLIVKTFRQHFGKAPNELFDEFELEAVNAASMGQVHRAVKDGQPLAVKVQYPGVGDSVISDLNMVKPFAKQLMGFKEKDIQLYFEEVKERLVEETDYELELQRSMTLSEQCAHIPRLAFADYYPELSSKRVITMSWLPGMHLDVFLNTNPSQEIRNQIGQALWDFYTYQLHQLKVMHADPHPGNFLFREDGTTGVLDFGCVKEIPEDFYEAYFTLIRPSILKDREAFIQGCRNAEMLLDSDTPEQVKFFADIFHEALSLVCQPFHHEAFDFADDSYFDKLYAYGERTGNMPELRKSRPRGSKHGIYLNRAFFGLYSILNKLGAKVETQHYVSTLD